MYRVNCVDLLLPLAALYFKEMDPLANVGYANIIAHTINAYIHVDKFVLDQ